MRLYFFIFYNNIKKLKKKLKKIYNYRFILYFFKILFINFVLLFIFRLLKLDVFLIFDLTYKIIERSAILIIYINIIYNLLLIKYYNRFLNFTIFEF